MARKRRLTEEHKAKLREKGQTHIGLPRDSTRRQRQIAALRCRGYTLDEITEALPHLGVTRDDGRPFSRAMVYKDLLRLDELWKEAAAGDIAKAKGRLLAELREARRAAWKESDIGLVLKALKQEAELLGLEDPKRLALTDPSGTEAYGTHIMQTILQLAEESGTPVVIDAEFVDKEVARLTDDRTAESDSG